MRIRTSQTALSVVSLIAALAIPATGFAAQVQLKSSDGSVDMTGEYVDFVDGYYVLRTDLGDLRVSSDRVDCIGAGCPTFDSPDVEVQIRGSDTIGNGLMPLLLSGYANNLNAESKVQETGLDGEIVATLVGESGYGDKIGSLAVTPTNSSDAFASLEDGSTDIGMSARRITRSEARALKEAGAGNMVNPAQEHLFAVDSLVVITHPSNPVDQISIEQLRDIYSGQITNWSELGGNDAPITVVNLQEGSGTRQVFKTRVFGDAASGSDISQSIVNDSITMAFLVNDDPNAIGYVGYAFQRGAKALDLINECGIVSESDSFAAKVEEYALQRRLYLYNRADLENGAANDFINYVMSGDADALIAKSGFIDLGIVTKSQDLDSQRAQTLLASGEDAYEKGIIREMMTEMVNYDRLSTTFRFRAASPRLDDRALDDMERLTAYLEGKPSTTSVLFVGFTDNTGTFDSNTELSISRAEQVVSELREFAGDRLSGINLQATGYGQLAPSACNLTDSGRAVNRRVEVWIKNG